VLSDLSIVVGEDTESVVIFSSTDIDLVVKFPLVVDVLDGSGVDINGFGWLVFEEEIASGEGADDGKSNKNGLLRSSRFGRFTQTQTLCVCVCAS